MADQEKEQDLCRGCGKPVTSAVPTGDRGDVYCHQCAIDRAEQYIREAQMEKPRLQQLRETRAWRIMMVIFLFLSMGTIAYQAPKLLAAFKEPKPVRMGTYETDENTDRCIRNLWHQAYLMQQGRPVAAPGTLCPATGKPYVVKQGPNQEVSCPNPERHGFQNIWVTKKNPAPELKR